MKLIYVLLTTFALGVTPALADDPDEPTEAELVQNPNFIPKCSLVKTKDGREMCAYELDEWISVLRIDALVGAQQRMLDQLHGKIEVLEEQQMDFRKQVAALTDNNKLLITSNDKLTKDLIDLDKKYQYERVKPRWGTTVSWGIAAASASILAGFVIRDALD